MNKSDAMIPWKDKMVSLKDSPNSKLKVVGANSNGSLRVKFLADYKPYKRGDYIIAMPYEIKEFGQKYSVKTFAELDNLPEAEERRRGKLIADTLQLPLNSGGRYDTMDGDKTDLGLFKTLKRYIIDGE